MIDLKYMEKNLEEVSEKLAKKGLGKEFIANLSQLFVKRKNNNALIEENKEEQNKLSKIFGQYKREGTDTTDLTEKINKLKKEAIPFNDKQEEIEKAFNKFLMFTPNIPADDVPFGKGEEDNIEIKKVLEPRKFRLEPKRYGDKPKRYGAGFDPKAHWDLADGWIDFEKGVKLAHSRFAVLNTPAAKLERALINFFLDENGKKGFQEVSVPVINNRAMLEGTGQLPKFENDLFKIDGEELFLIPTGEVPLTNLFNDEIIGEDEFPILLTANTLCFRKEAGSAGRDTRGIIRQHQFNKVEMVAITTPEKSEEIYQMMIENASDLLTKLGLPHRLVQLCSGDLGFSATKTVDLEVWLPSEGKYKEISSVSHMGDFQARRAKIRYKDGKKNKFVNTLNGSALAVGRTIVAIMENYQEEDGTISIPEVLKKYII